MCSSSRRLILWLAAPQNLKHSQPFAVFCILASKSHICSTSFGRHTTCVMNFSYRLTYLPSHSALASNGCARWCTLEAPHFSVFFFLSHLTSFELTRFKGRLVATWSPRLGFYPATNKLYSTLHLIWYDMETLKFILVEVEVHVGRAPLCRDWQARHLKEHFNFLRYWEASWYGNIWTWWLPKPMIGLGENLIFLLESFQHFRKLGDWIMIMNIPVLWSLDSP